MKLNPCELTGSITQIIAEETGCTDSFDRHPQPLTPEERGRIFERIERPRKAQSATEGV